ncbi:MAG: hypothetical protein GF335_01355 [Candidatus Moranbacteria bacterium]|nr:hypothetical protein [Candidatus Moranbacteria bacterium]
MKKPPIKVRLISSPDQNPKEITKLAALECKGKSKAKINLNHLFQSTHHTPFQHNYFTFQIKNIAIADITFGLHLTHPFYNSDQKSGSLCAQMFENPDFERMESYIKIFWPQIKPGNLKKIMAYIKKCTEIYNKNFPKTLEETKKLIKKERPYADEKFLKQRAPKINQEQLRMFIPSIFPTSIVYTLNLTALAAMYESAWNPVLRFITQEMAEEILKTTPELDFLFKKSARRKTNWHPYLDKTSKNKIVDEVEAVFDFESLSKLINKETSANYTLPDYKIMSPLDKLHFTPELMNNTFEEIKAQIKGPLVTMGQDQRHRTIKRSIPIFTGDFYLPPIAKKCDLEKEAKKVLKMWKNLSKKIPGTLAAVIAPLGCVVHYKKRGSLNAVCHEQSGRLCWFHQREIYELSRQLRASIKKQFKKHPILKLLEPPCYKSGKCTRGEFYCGRDLMMRKENNYFPKRKV